MELKKFYSKFAIEVMVEFMSIDELQSLYFQLINSSNYLENTAISPEELQRSIELADLASILLLEKNHRMHE